MIAQYIIADPYRGGKTSGYRSVTISHYIYQRREVIAFQQAEEFDTIMLGSSTAEQVLSGVGHNLFLGCGSYGTIHSVVVSEPY